MIDLLIDEEGQLIIMSLTSSDHVWDSFNLNKASEYDLVLLLKSSVIA